VKLAKSQGKANPSTLGFFDSNQLLLLLSATNPLKVRDLMQKGENIHTHRIYG
jgi:hypothetical protein